jgi:hypothetical protein
MRLKSSLLLARFGPYLLLCGLLTITFLILAALNLNLGFVGDVLGFEYHFDRFGLKEGMRYVLDWDRRHLLSGQYYAVLHTLFPGQSAAWYATSLLTQFLIAPACFLLSDALLRGRRRWIAFSAALIFVFYTRQTWSHFQTPTSGYRKIAVALALVSIWFFLQYVRGKRYTLLWRDLSIAFYAISVLLYEATALFFLLHPIITFFEDRPGPALREKWKWLVQAALDSWWYPVIFVTYWYLLNVLLPEYQGPRGTNLTPGAILGQIAAAFQAEFSPDRVASRLAPALEGTWLLLTLMILAASFLLVWRWSWRTEAAGDLPTALNQIALSGTTYLTVIGAAMIVLNVLSVAPNERFLGDEYHSPRLLSPSAVGIAFLVTGGLAWLLDHVRRIQRRRAVFALVVAFLVATGVTRLFQVQQQHAVWAQERERFLEALKDVAPSWAGGELPYLLIVSNAHPTRDLDLHAQDTRFPLMFDMLYGVDGIAADAIYPDVPASAAPAPDVPGSLYSGPYIVVEPEGIYSPLNPRVPIDPQRLVIVYYDSQTQTARILDDLPPEVLETANIVQRAPIEWRTNHDLIGS